MLSESARSLAKKYIRFSIEDGEKLSAGDKVQWTPAPKPRQTASQHKTVSFSEDNLEQDLFSSIDTVQDAQNASSSTLDFGSATTTFAEGPALLGSFRSRTGIAENVLSNFSPTFDSGVVMYINDSGGGEGAGGGDDGGAGDSVPFTRAPNTSRRTRTRRRPQSRISSATSIMDERYRCALLRHYRLLMTHISLTDDIIDQMAKEKILPETMIKDIQAADTKEERNECLLNSLRLRGNNCFKKFRELMYRTGNYFVADLLWEEDDACTIDQDDLARFPGLFDMVPNDQKKKLSLYLDSKLREKALMLAWREAPKERKQALYAKVSNFHQERIFRDTIMEQEQRVKTLESIVCAKEACISELEKELRVAKERVVQGQKDYRQAMETQGRFHDANLSTISKLKSRVSHYQSRIQRLDKQTCATIEVNDDFIKKSDEDDDDSILTVFDRHFKKLLARLNTLQEQVDADKKQRDDVLALLNRKNSQEPVLHVVKDVLRHEQRHRSIVMRDILKLASVLKQLPDTPLNSSDVLDPSTLETKQFKSRLAMLKAEAEHMQKKMTWKDSEIASLKAEVARLRNLAGVEDSETTQSSSGTSLPGESPSRATSSSPARQPQTSSAKLRSGVVAMAAASSLKSGTSNTPRSLPVPPRSNTRDSFSKSARSSPSKAARKDAKASDPSKSPAKSSAGGKRGPADAFSLGSISSPKDSRRTNPSPRPADKRSGQKLVTFGQGPVTGVSGSRSAENGDLDKTHVDVEQYLQQINFDSQSGGAGDSSVKPDAN